MEQKFTNRSNSEIVPSITGDFWESFPEFEEAKVVSTNALDFEGFQRRLDEETKRILAESELLAQRLARDSEEWQKNALMEIQKRRSEMDFEEYVDDMGYKVCEGRTKDGKYVISQKTRTVGNTVEHALEIVEDGNIMFRTSSLTDSYSYRNGNGDFVTVEEKKSGKISQRVYTTPHARVVKKRRKKTTHKWKLLLFGMICAVVIYFVFFR